MRGGLIAVARQGRSMNYRADLDGFRGLIDFMLRDCCGGRPEICAPVVDEFNASGCAPAPTHDPEKWKPVFGKDHAQCERAAS